MQLQGSFHILQAWETLPEVSACVHLLSDFLKVI